MKSTDRQLQPLTSVGILQVISLLLLVFGAIARVVRYASNRSLWHDEAAVALNIVNRSYGELLGALGGNQAAPPLFLWLEKAAVQIGGNNEYALRFFPAIAGLMALILFYRLARDYTRFLATPIAIALFASLRYLLRYANEVKPYGIDLAVAMLLFLVLSHCRKDRLATSEKIGLSVLGAICIWLSFPSIFVLAGVELAGWLEMRKNWRERSLHRWPVYGVWLASFGSLYWLAIAPTLGNADLVESFRDRYPENGLDIVWLFDALGRFFSRPLGFSGFTDGVAIFAFLCGCIAIYRRSPQQLLLLNAPLGITLFAAYLHQYPFRERLILFLVPFAVLIIAEGIAFLLTPIADRHWLTTALGIVVAILLVGSPLYRCGMQLVEPERMHFHHIRPAIAYIRDRWQPSDEIYIFPSARVPFSYYAQREQIPQERYQFGDRQIPKQQELTGQLGEQYLQAIAQLPSGERVWFLLIFDRDDLPPPEMLLAEFDRVGTRLDVTQPPDVLACLYRLF